MVFFDLKPRLTSYALLLSCYCSALYGQTNTIEEIVVTAQKRTENLQDVPIAVTVFDASLLEGAGIDAMGAVAQHTPGFSFTSYNKTTPQPYIRGIGSNTSGAGDDASVGVFIDQVYISRAGNFDTNLFDIAQLEVLRGPQGSLYGKNVIGGALNISTIKPNVEQAEIKLRLDAGSYDKRGAQLFLTSPLTEAIAGKLALAQNKRDGFVHNTVTGKKLRDENAQDGRAGLLWQASDQVEININIDASHVRESGVGRVLQGEPAFGITASSPSINDRDNTDSSIDGYTERDNQGASITVDWQQPYGTWTSITADRSTEYSFEDEIIPALGAPYYAKNFAQEKQQQFSQELRLASLPEAGNWQWTLGLYYFSERVERLESYDTMYLFSLGGLGTWDANNDTQSQAVFGQLSYLWQDWRFTLGGRHTEESKDFELDVAGYEPLFFSLYAPFSASSKKSWQNISKKFSVDYVGFDNKLIYLSLSEGFKSGAFNSLSSTQTLAETPLDPELATQWELGLKSQWQDDLLRLNAALFTIDYDDLQIFETVGFDVYVGNAARAASKGAELELTLLPINGLEVSANYAYLDANYDQYQLGGIDNSGNRLSRSPIHSYNLSCSYQYPLNTGNMEFRLDYVSQSKIYRTADNSEGNRIAGYALVNASVSFSSVDNRWQLRLWGKNLGNETYELFRNDLSSLGAATHSDILGDPRTLGVTVNYLVPEKNR